VTVSRRPAPGRDAELPRQWRSGSPHLPNPGRREYSVPVPATARGERTHDERQTLLRSDRRRGAGRDDDCTLRDATRPPDRRLREGGSRHASVSHVHNLYGVSEDVSGRQPADYAVEQLEEYGGDYYPDEVPSVRWTDDAEYRSVVAAPRTTIEAERVVFATGFTDPVPSVPDLRRFSGRGLHYCPRRAAYPLGDQMAFVFGHDDRARQRSPRRRANH